MVCVAFGWIDQARSGERIPPNPHLFSVSLALAAQQALRRKQGTTFKLAD
jgi:hypothetical protein